MRPSKVHSIIIGIAIGAAALGAQARGLRIDTSFGQQQPQWGTISVDLSSLPPALGYPAGLLVNPLSTSNPMSLADLAAANRNTNIVQSGYGQADNTCVSNCALVPTVTLLDTEDTQNGALPFTYDSQAPGWVTPAYNCVPPASSGQAPFTTLYYACPSNPIYALDMEFTWAGNPGGDDPGENTYEQIIFFNLGTVPKTGTSPGAQVYDASDYDCEPNDLDASTGSPCKYHNLGTANQAWQLAFNCGIALPTGDGGFGTVPPGTPPPCAGGASLQWQGRIYTASSYVLTTPDPEHPSLGPALNEFVYSNGVLRVPPGWVSFVVSSTTLKASASNVAFGTPLTLTATVELQAGKNVGSPHGIVDFYDGATVIGHASVAVGGGAFTIKHLPTGVHNFTAKYRGNSANAPSSSSVVPVTVS